MAIDPGASGGIVEVDTKGRVVSYAMPDDHDLKENIRAFKRIADVDGEECIAYMELVGGFIHGKKLPGSAMFNFGNGYGCIRGMLMMADIPFVLVRPQDWQVGIPGVRGEKEKADRKRAIKEHAARLFPNLKVTLKTADALCLALYAMRHVSQTGIAQPQLPISTP